jgi:hypothetical protein
VFTSALLEGLSGNADSNEDGYITSSELESYLSWRGSNRFQTPASGVLPGHEGGQFAFRSLKYRVSSTPPSDSIPKILIKRGDSDQEGRNSEAKLGHSDIDRLGRAKKLLAASRFSEAICTAHHHLYSAKICYRYHPCHGVVVQLVRYLRRGSAAVVIVRLPDGSQLAIPEWMLKPETARS